MGIFELAAPDELTALRGVAFDYAPAPSLVISEAGMLVMANIAAERLLGEGLGLLRRRSLRKTLGQGDPLIAAIDQALRIGGEVHEESVTLALPDRPPLEAAATATLMEHGQVLITLNPKSHAEERSRAAHAVASVAGMGRTLAHEIKNPLAGIRGAAQLLKDGASADDAALAQLVIDETDRVRRLVDRLEAFSDEREPERRPVNIHRVLGRVRALMATASGSGVAFRERFDPSLPHVLGDEDQLIQIFLNLVKNAAEAAQLRGDGRGEVTLSTAYRHGAPATPLEVRVQDNGPGVVPALRERLFEPFVTSKPQGAGLGLTLVAKLTAAHGGVVDLTSEPGATAFIVNLPLKTAR